MLSESRQARILLVRDYVQSMRERIRALRPRAQESPALAFDEACSEIETAHEDLTVAVEELRAQAAAIDALRARMEDELAHYRALFDDAPDGYVVTDARGLVLEANRTIAKALGVSRRFLERKPLISFVVRGDCPAFRASLAGLASSADTARLVLGLRPRNGHAPFVAEIRAVRVRPHEERPLRIRWSVRLLAPDGDDTLESAALARTITRITAAAAIKGRKLVVDRAAERELSARAAVAVGAILESLVAIELTTAAPAKDDLRVVIAREEEATVVHVGASRARLPIG